MKDYENIEDYLKEKYLDYEDCQNGYYTICSKIYKMKDDFEVFTPIEEAIGRAGKWGLCDKNGNEIIKPQYLFPLIPFKNYYLTTLPIFDKNISFKRYVAKIKGTLSGLVDINNNEIIPIKYNWLDNIDKDGNLFIAGIKSKKLINTFNYGIIDTDNNLIAPFKYDYIQHIRNEIKSNYEYINQIEVEKDGYIGVYDLNDKKEIIKPKYKYLEIIKKNVFLVSEDVNGARMNGKIIDEKENKII